MSDDDRTPDVDRGPERRLSDRAARLAARRAGTDRRARFQARLADVRRDEARRQRRQRRLDRIVVALVVLGLPAAGWWTATLVDDLSVGAGIAGGVVAAAVVLVARRWGQRYARSRGAQAWDWTTGRHVTHGDPSKRVQDMTGGADQRPDRDRRRGPLG